MLIICIFVDTYYFGYSAIKQYKEDLNKVPKKKVLWENMAVLIHSLHILFMSSMEIVIQFYLVFQGVPVQTGNKDCGLFVMRYMKEIVHDKELDFVSKVRISLSLDFLTKFVFTSTRM